MKRCPECGREYDNSLSFCLDDGAELLYGPAASHFHEDAWSNTGVTGADDPATAIMTSEAPTRVVSGQGFSSDRAPAAASSNRRVSAIAALGVFLAVVLGVGGYWFYSNRSDEEIRSIAVLPCCPISLFSRATTRFATIRAIWISCGERDSDSFFR